MNTPNTTHQKLRCSSPEATLELLHKDKPAKVIKTLNADTVTPVSLTMALAALEAAHGKEAVATFISNLWKKKSNAGQYAVQREMNADWISEQLSKV